MKNKEIRKIFSIIILIIIFVEYIVTAFNILPPRENQEYLLGLVILSILVGNKI